MDRVLQILLVDDDEVDRLAVRRALNKVPRKIVIDEVLDKSSGMEALLENEYDCAIVDYLLPDGDAVTFVEEANEQMESPPPVVVLTGQGDRKVDLAVMKAGAAEYLEKDGLSSDVLERTVRYAIKNHGLVQKLKETNERLKELDRLKSEFLSTASHELRTPLTIIREFVALVNDGVTGEITDEQKECLESALFNCDRLGGIINDLLDLQRIESGKLRLVRRRRDIRTIVERCCNDFLPACEKKNQSLGFELDDELVPVLCDEEKITQVLVNLVGNAYKFTQAGGSIMVRALLEDGFVTVGVEDNGPGISDEDRKKIFEKFTQIRRNVGPGKKGTGLGLAISQKIMALHEGEISVEGSEGEGSRFSFRLPVYDEEKELLAFVKDHAHFDNVEETDWTVLMLEHVSGHMEGLETLQRTESMAKRTMRCDDDGVMLIESSSQLVILLQSCAAGANSLLDRMGAAIVNEFGPDVIFNYKVVPVVKDNMKDICQILDGQEFIRLDLNLKYAGLQVQ